MAKPTEVAGILLQRLEEYLKSLREHRKVTQDELEDSDVLLTYVERKLQLAAQVSIDLGNHLIAYFGFETPKDYKDIFEILAKEGVISKDLSSNMKKIAGFRNILVHDYLSIDVGKCVCTHTRLQMFCTMD